mmetsp:Transcript_21123/g.60297  ORF Transcript_21123/g.60297 Transcript_21123/m.60297 type:complete len:115 (+) Transcript_21123:1662-2006(+)
MLEPPWVDAECTDAGGRPSVNDDLYHAKNRGTSIMKIAVLASILIVSLRLVERSRSGARSNRWHDGWWVMQPHHDGRGRRMARHAGFLSLVHRHHDCTSSSSPSCCSLFTFSRK